MVKCTKDEREVLDALKKHRAYQPSPGPYPKSPRKAGINRWRLFTDSERRVLRNALAGSEGYGAIEGGAGMLDDLEMINYDTGGLWPERLAKLVSSNG